jgi:hypothetical protein
VKCSAFDSWENRRQRLKASYPDAIALLPKLGVVATERPGRELKNASVLILFLIPHSRSAKLATA